LNGNNQRELDCTIFYAYLIFHSPYIFLFRTDLVAAYVDDLEFSVEDHKSFIDKLKVQAQRHRCHQILLGTWFILQWGWHIMLGAL